MTSLQLPQCFVCGCLFFPTFSATTNDFFESWIISLFHIWSQKVNVIDLVALILCFVLYEFTWIRGIVVDGKYDFYLFYFFFYPFLPCVCALSLQELLRMRISFMSRGRWTQWEIWRSSTRSWGWRTRRWSAPLLTSWRRRPLEAVTRNSNQNMWVNVPADPLLPLTARHK